MDKETLSNYGWIVILVLVLSVLLALATPFGLFVTDAIKSTTAGLFSVNESSLGAAGITIPGQDFENTDAPVVNLNPDGVIPEGGQYTAKDGTIYNPGDEFPEVVTDGDVYKYGDYEYKYNYYWYHGYYWSSGLRQNGWGVLYINKDNPTPGPICENINGQPVNTLFCTFQKCKNITTAPVIPSTVTNMNRTFDACFALKTYVGSTDAEGDFTNFVIPEGVTDFNNTFAACRSMVIAPIIPDHVTKLSSTFDACFGLTTAPVIPSQITYLYQTFRGCTALTGTVEINTNNITSTWEGAGQTAYYCFEGVNFEEQNLTLVGTASNLDTIGQTSSIHYCTECNGKCNDSENHAQYLYGHIGGYEEQTCTQKPKCSLCGVEYGSTKSHNYVKVEDAEWIYSSVSEHKKLAMCTNGCGKTTYHYQSHSGGTATCTQKAVCEVCNSEYGAVASHNVENGICTECGQNVTVIESEHNPYPNNLSSILGTWDYTGAQSVTITIECDTWGTSQDWVELRTYTSNNQYKYIDMDGNLKNSQYKFGDWPRICTFTTTAVTGSVYFRTNYSGNDYYGVKVQVTPNY